MLPVYTLPKLCVFNASPNTFGDHQEGNEPFEQRIFEPSRRSLGGKLLREIESPRRSFDGAKL